MNSRLVALPNHWTRFNLVFVITHGEPEYCHQNIWRTLPAHRADVDYVMVLNDGALLAARAQAPRALCWTSAGHPAKHEPCLRLNGQRRIVRL